MYSRLKCSHKWSLTAPSPHFPKRSSTFGTYKIGTVKILLKLWRKKSMAYYHELVTQKSWEELQKLKKLVDFVLIGGWATYLYTKGLKSKDIYLPHFSQIGIPIEVLVDKAKSVEGFAVLEINYLVALKIFALQQRGRSLKGRKDMLDIISLIQLESFDYKKTRRILRSHKLEPSLKTLNEMLSE